MWGEGASDLWGRLERDEDEREAELIEAMRERLGSAGTPDGDGGEPAASLAGLGTAARGRPTVHAQEAAEAAVLRTRTVGLVSCPHPTENVRQATEGG
jgi:hypothetical protein